MLKFHYCKTYAEAYDKKKEIIKNRLTDAKIDADDDLVQYFMNRSNMKIAYILNETDFNYYNKEEYYPKFTVVEVIAE